MLQQVGACFIDQLIGVGVHRVKFVN